MDSVDNNIATRKIEHIRLSLLDEVVVSDNCKQFYDEILLVHRALPGLDFRDVTLETSFLGYRLNAPLMITGMTGGHKETYSINAALARVANRFRIAIGVGSQRSMLVNRGDVEVTRTYRVVRDEAREVPVIGNIGANTLLDISVEDVVFLVEEIEADAIAIHLNPAQEVVQPEGDTRFSPIILEKVREIVRHINKPVIIKEVGFGLSMDVARDFYSIGVKIFDVAGSCGTNWALVEALRHQERSARRDVGFLLRRWGIPTPLAVIETRSVAPESIIIASGGVWDGLKGAMNLALGANIVGFARPALKAYAEGGVDAVSRFIERYIEELKTILFLTGSRELKDLRKAPVVLGPIVQSYLAQRGINPDYYLKIVRSIT